MALHTVRANSFVGFGGSDLGNRQKQDINEHDDDGITVGNDVGSCGGFGGVGSGGMALEEAVMSRVVRGSAVVAEVVEVLSNERIQHNEDSDDI